MKKVIMLTIGALSIGVMPLLSGCGSSADKEVIQPKWKGEPYRISFDTKTDPKAKPPKPNPAVITIPPVTFTANPEALENRAVLVVKFDAPGTGNQGEITNRIVGTPVDIKGTDGTLPADYMDRASKGLTDYLSAYCLQGKVSISVALARSSLNPHPDDSELENKRLSDWLPTEATYKNPHSKCK